MTRLSPVKAILSAQQLFNGANELNRFKGFDNVGIGSDFHALWWMIATFRSELMPNPWQALTSNLDYILHPFYRRGPGNLGIGWLLLASLRRVLIRPPAKIGTDYVQ